jgi:hypothetical protein
MRIAMLVMVILGVGCGTVEPIPPVEDSGSSNDAGWLTDGQLGDAGADAGVDAVVEVDAFMLPVEDAGVDAGADGGSDGGADAFMPAVDAGTDAGTDAGSDAGPPPPPVRPSTVVELGDARCFRDSAGHAWCLRGSPLAPVYVGDADRIFGECALVGDEVQCIGASGMLEPNGQHGVQIAQHSTATRGCVIPTSRDRAVCWFAEGDVWTFTRAMATFVDAAVPTGTGTLPRTVNLLFHFPAAGADGVRQAGAGALGGGTVDVVGGVTFSEPVTAWGSNGNGLCWLGTGGQVRCRTTWNGADGVPIAGGTRWTAFDDRLVCADDFCRFPGSSLSGGFFGGSLRHVELGEIYAYDSPSTIRGTDLRSTWMVTW